MRYARTSKEGPQGGWQPQEKISLANCIRAYTSGSAYGEFMEGKKGELNVGEFADIERPHERWTSGVHE